MKQEELIRSSYFRRVFIWTSYRGPGNFLFPDCRRTVTHKTRLPSRLIYEPTKVQSPGSTCWFSSFPSSAWIKVEAYSKIKRGTSCLIAINILALNRSLSYWSPGTIFLWTPSLKTHFLSPSTWLPWIDFHFIWEQKSKQNEESFDYSFSSDSYCDWEQMLQLHAPLRNRRAEFTLLLSCGKCIPYHNVHSCAGKLLRVC